MKGMNPTDYTQAARGNLASISLKRSDARLMKQTKPMSKKREINGWKPSEVIHFMGNRDPAGTPHAR
jgi:hypothetical protein